MGNEISAMTNPTALTAEERAFRDGLKDWISIEEDTKTELEILCGYWPVLLKRILQVAKRLQYDAITQAEQAAAAQAIEECAVLVREVCPACDKGSLTDNYGEQVECQLCAEIMQAIRARSGKGGGE